uniref:Putative secreted protein n=1 Tax=Anopheles darlingi TaxID=43151 RepID=A0A2M4DIH8_ANODA
MKNGNRTKAHPCAVLCCVCLCLRVCIEPGGSERTERTDGTNCLRSRRWAVHLSCFWFRLESEVSGEH